MSKYKVQKLALAIALTGGSAVSLAAEEQNTSLGDMAVPPSATAEQAGQQQISRENLGAQEPRAFRSTSTVSGPSADQLGTTHAEESQAPYAPSAGEVGPTTDLSDPAMAGETGRAAASASAGGPTEADIDLAPSDRSPQTSAAQSEGQWGAAAGEGANPESPATPISGLGETSAAAGATGTGHSTEAAGSDDADSQDDERPVAGGQGSGNTQGSLGAERASGPAGRAASGAEEDRADGGEAESTMTEARGATGNMDSAGRQTDTDGVSYESREGALDAPDFGYAPDEEAQSQTAAALPTDMPTQSPANSMVNALYDTISFDEATAELSAEAEEALDGLAQQINPENPATLTIRVEDYTGAAEAGAGHGTLAQKRGQNVKDYLTEKGVEVADWTVDTLGGNPSPRADLSMAMQPDQQQIIITILSRTSGPHAPS